MQIEIAVIRRHLHHLLALDQLLAHAAIRDQALDGADAESVLFAELHQLRQPRHRAVVVQNFAKHAGRLQAGEPRKIDRRLGVTGATQHAALLGAQREDVPGLDEIFRLRVRIGDRRDRLRAIVRADAGRDAIRRVDRDGEIGPIHLAVLRHHALQAELLRAFVRNRHADQAAAMHGHEVDRFRRGFLRRHHEIALVLAIFVVGHDHDLACRDVAHDIVDRVEFKRWRCLSQHRLLDYCPAPRARQRLIRPAAATASATIASGRYMSRLLPWNSAFSLT